MTDDLVRRLNEDFSVNAREDIQHQIKVYEAERKEAADRIEQLEEAQGRLVAALRVNMLRLSGASHEEIDALIRVSLEEKKDD